jgi:hypothetical protein
MRPHDATKSFITSRQKVMIALSVGTFLVNIGLMLGALYHKRELLVPWLVYYTLLFIFCFFVRLPAVDEEVTLRLFLF